MGFSESLGKAVIEVRATTKNLKQDMSKATKTVQGAAGKMRASLAAVGTAFAPVAIIAGIVGIGKAAVGASANMETLKVAFTSLLGSEGEANKVLDELKEFSSKTPFQIENVAQAARQMLAAGTATSELKDQMKVMGDVAAGANVPLTDMAGIFAKIQNKGKAYTEELLQLSDRGIPILQTLATQLGLTKDEVFELASQGKLTADVMASAFQAMTSEGGPFFDQMNQQSETLAGKWSTLKDNLVLLAAAIGDTLAPIFKGLLDIMIAVTTKLNEFISAVKSAVGWAGKMSSEVGGTISKGMTKMKDTVSKATEATSDAFFQMYDAVVGHSFVPDMVDEVGQHMDRLDQVMVDQADTATDKVSNKFSKMSDEVTKEMSTMKSEVNNILDDLLGQLPGPIGGIAKSLLGGIFSGGGSESEGGGGIGSILGGLGGIFGSGDEGGGGFLGGIGDIFGGFFAEGGKPPVGKVSVVGEKGPELFMPTGSGTVIPNDAMGGGGGVTVNINQNYALGVQDTVRAEIMNMRPVFQKDAVSAVTEAVSRGGTAAKAIRGK